MGETGIPVRIVFEHGVEDDQELAHAGGDDDLEWLSGGVETVSEGPDDGVATSGSECGHVEGTADGRSSTPDGAFALEATTVVVEGRQTDEGTDLLAIESTELRELSQQRGRGGWAHAGGAAEDLGF